MRIFSFDIFDTCLIRKCGDPQNLLDILSWLVFNGQVSDNVRKEFVMARRMADVNTYDNACAKLADIYDSMSYSHPLLKTKEELVYMEEELERKMLLPVPEIVAQINTIRSADTQIMFISDMYLSGDFLASILMEQGLMQAGDRLYVSCEVGKRKASGDLFEYIKEKEHIQYDQWCHYGDNLLSDYLIPKKLGIKTNKVCWKYLPYQMQWLYEPSPQNRTLSTLAGVCRALHHSLPYSSHKDFLVDLAAPLFTSFTYRVLRQAQNDGINHLYFCARDTGTVFRIAQKLHPLFPNIELHYLYISRDALYKGSVEVRKRYFEQCGLASQSNQCAIVDLRTSGKTLCVLNQQLLSNGYLPVKGYFFEMFCTGNLDHIPQNYYAELQSPYYTQKSSTKEMFIHHYLVEMYISVHNEKRTIDYKIEDGQAVPIFAQIETEFSEDSATMPNYIERCIEHRNTLLSFTQFFIDTMLYQYVDQIFDVALRTWVQFSNYPQVEYIGALTDFYSSKPNSTDCLPYVKKMNLLELFLTRGKKTIWKRASIMYSLPSWIRSVYVKRIQRSYKL